MVFRIVDPFDALRDFQRALDATRSSRWFDRGTTGTGGFPMINVFAQGDDCVVVAELPGVSRDEIEINVKGSQLRIRGKKDISYQENISVHRRERRAGRFDRTLNLPIEVDKDGVKAQYEDGVLAVFVPRAEADKPRTITIN